MCGYLNLVRPMGGFRAGWYGVRAVRRSNAVIRGSSTVFCYTFQAGPRVASRSSRARVFGQCLVGPVTRLVHVYDTEFDGFDPLPFDVYFRETDFAVTPGGGVDVGPRNILPSDFLRTFN